MPWVWSACSWVKSTPCSQSTSASSSCSRRSGEVSTSTRVTPAPLRRSTSSDVRRRRFLGLPGSQAPQPRAGRGTPPEEPEPRIVKRSVMPHACSDSRRLRSKPLAAGHPARDLAKELEEVLARLPRNLLGRSGAGLGQDAGGLDHECRLVALAAMAARGEIRRVGLDHDALRRQRLRDGAQLVRLLEGQDAGEGDEKPERDRAVRELATAG